jgi:tetratricopeptide (TPR) repeat protein
LGQLLINAGDFAGAIIELREAIKLKSNDSETHKHLGWALINNSQPDEAIPILREAVRLKPDYSEAWACLGVALTNTRKYDEAAEVFRKMIRGKPNDAIALYNLGVTLGSSGKNSEAADAYREVIRIKPDYAEAYCTLGMILRTQGDFAGSLSMIHKGHELGSAQPAWRYPSKQWVSQAERFAGLAQRMEGIQNGAEQPGDNAERLTFAQMFYWSKQYATAAQLWSDALVVEPKIAEDRQASYRYNAACAAALAAAQHANDEQPSTENEKLRNQALAHLQAELEVWDKLLESANENQRALVSHNMNHWRNVDPDLVSVRDPDALARLPKTEREQWNALWARVDKLIGRAKKAP